MGSSVVMAARINEHVFDKGSIAWLGTVAGRCRVFDRCGSICGVEEEKLPLILGFF